jgi:hypothetical protein
VEFWFYLEREVLEEEGMDLPEKPGEATRSPRLHERRKAFCQSKELRRPMFAETNKKKRSQLFTTAETIHLS